MYKIILFVLLFVVLSFGFFKSREKGLSAELSSAIKGVGAVMIVLTHCVTQAAAPGSFWNHLSTGYLTVAVFFFLSGFGSAYGLCRKEGYVRRFLPTRFVRVYVPFLLALILYAVVYAAAGDDIAVSDFFRSMVGDVRLMGHAWYVFAALFFYLSIWIAFRVTSRSAVRIAVLTALNLAFSFALWRIVGDTHDHWFISNLSFVLGAALQIYDPALRHRKIVLPAAAVCAVCGFALLPVCSRVFGGYVYPAYILSCNLGSGFLAAALVLLLTLTAAPNPVTRYLGKISYEIYLYHMLFVRLLWKFFHLGVLPLFLAATALTIAFSALMHIADMRLCGALDTRKKKTAAQKVL